MLTEPRSTPRLAIVVPCYNEEEVLSFCLEQLGGCLDAMVQEKLIRADSYLLFVDDGSRDATWTKISQACAEHSYVQGVKLSRNEGHQAALQAGLAVAEKQADAIVSIDADLQDDISAIEAMVKAYRSGYDVVYGVRESRQADTWFKRTTAEGYYRLMALMGVKQKFNHADYRLLSARALQALQSYTERNVYLRGLVPLVGFPSTEVHYSRGIRTAGESKYPLHKMLALAIEGVTSMTVAPLRLIASLGFLICAISVCAMCYAVLTKIRGYTVAGWSSIVLSIFFMGGVQMLSLGIIGEYIGKIYLETKQRPRFHIEKILGQASVCSKDDTSDNL